MNNEILLSICIPTYNRQKYLVECLESILMQVEDKNNVEIFISDNASQDETQNIVSGYLKKYDFIKYNRNDTNSGPDRNFLQCMQKANGEYVHIMSDDDIMLSGCVDAVLECIGQNKPDLLHLNNCGFSSKFIDKEHCSRPRLEDGMDLITTDKDKFLSQLGVYITFLPTLVFKRKNINNILNPEQFIGSYFLQSHIALLCTKGNSKLVISKFCGIAARGGNTGGYNLYEVWVKQYKKLLLETAIDAGYSQKCVNKLYKHDLIHMVRGSIASYRLKNIGFDLSNRRILFECTWMYPRAWLLLYPFAFMPLQLLKTAQNAAVKAIDFKNKFRK